MSEERKGRSRPVRGSAKVLFKKGLYEDIRDSVRELLANAMTWMWVANVPPAERKIYLTLNEGNSRDLVCEDPGTGVAPKDYDDFSSMGHDSNDIIHYTRMKSPEFISQIGIGINSYLALSKVEEVEFRTVSEDEKGRKTGLIARMWGTENDIEMDDKPWMGDPAEALNHRGMKVIIKQAKSSEYLSKKELIDHIGKTFTLKLKDYQVMIRDAKTDLEYERILPSNEFCTKHMDKLFELSDGTEVRGDIHHLDPNQIDKRIIRTCVKKVRMEDSPTKYLAHGIINTNSLNVKFQVNRGGFRRQDDSLFPELEIKLNQWLADNDFKTPAEPKEEKVKDQKGLNEVIADSLLRLVNSKYKDIMKNLAGSISKAGIKGKADQNNREDDEWELYAKDQKRMLTGSTPEGRIIRRPTDFPGGTKPTHIDEPGNDPQYHGYEDGGNQTVQQPKRRQPQETETTIVPRFEHATVRMQQSFPVSELVVDDLGMLKWKVNLRNKTGLRIAATGKARDDLLLKSCLHKAISDFVAKQEGWGWDEASEMWEFLQSEESQ